MKKLKFVCFGLMTIFLLFFGVFSFGVGVKAAYEDDWGAPESAKNYAEPDGRGIRLYIIEVYDDENGFLEYANMAPIRDYVFDDGELAEGTDQRFGRLYFDSDVIDICMYYLDVYGAGNPIPEWDRLYVYYYPKEESFWAEYYGRNYAGYLLEYYSALFDEMGYDRYYDYGYEVGYHFGYSDGFNEGNDEGYNEGYYAGYDAGHEDGYIEGILAGESEAYERGFVDGQESKLAQNNEAFYQGIEKWLVPAIITVIALGGFVTIAARKRREE